MKTRTLISGIVAVCASLAILVSSIIRFFDDTKSVAALVLLIISSIAIIAGAVLGYLYNEKLGALAIFSGSLVGLIGFRIASNVVEGIFITPQSQLIVWFICLLASFIVSIITYANFKKKEKVKVLERLNIVSLIIAVITIIFISYLVNILIDNGSLVTPFICITIIVLIVAAKVLSIIFNMSLGSLMILLVPILVIMGIVPYEIGQNDNSVILMLIVDVLAFVLLISESKIIKGKE